MLCEQRLPHAVECAKRCPILSWIIGTVLCRCTATGTTWNVRRPFVCVVQNQISKGLVYIVCLPRRHGTETLSLLQAPETVESRKSLSKTCHMNSRNLSVMQIVQTVCGITILKRQRDAPWTQVMLIFTAVCGMTVLKCPREAPWTQVLEIIRTARGLTILAWQRQVKRMVQTVCGITILKRQRDAARTQVMPIFKMVLKCPREAPWTQVRGIIKTVRGLTILAWPRQEPWTQVHVCCMY